MLLREFVKCVITESDHVSRSKELADLAARDQRLRKKFGEEMDTIENAINAGERDKVTTLMSDKWLDDCTISGSASFARDRLAEWAASGVHPIAVMSSTSCSVRPSGLKYSERRSSGTLPFSLTPLFL